MVMQDTPRENEIECCGRPFIVRKSKKGRLYYIDPHYYEIKYVWCTGCEKMHEEKEFGKKKGREGVAAFHSTCKYHRRGGPLKIRRSHKPNEIGYLKCKKCLRELPKECFHSTRKEKGQFHSACKKCDLERKRARSQKLRDGKYETKKVVWNKEKIIQEIKNLNYENEDLSVRGIRFKNGKLYAAALRHFGSWSKAIDDSGLSYQEVCKMKMAWDIEKIKLGLMHRKNENKSMKSSVIRLEEADLYGACLKVCGGYKEAFDITFGEGAFLKNFIGSEQAFAFGFEFEKIVKEVFSLLSYKFEYQRSFENGSFRPDFYSEDLDHIYEVKLSEYTDYNGRNTFLKYGHLAKNISIIYLQQNAKKKNIYKNDVEMISIDYFVEQIENTELKKTVKTKLTNLKGMIDKL